MFEWRQYKRMVEGPRTRDSNDDLLLPLLPLSNTNTTTMSSTIITHSQRSITVGDGDAATVIVNDGSGDDDVIVDDGSGDDDRLHMASSLTTTDHMEEQRKKEFSSRRGRKIAYFDLSSDDAMAAAAGDEDDDDDDALGDFLHHHPRASDNGDDDDDGSSHSSDEDLQDQLATIRSLFKRAVTVNKLHSASWVGWAKFEQKSGHPGEAAM